MMKNVIAKKFITVAIVVETIAVVAIVGLVTLAKIVLNKQKFFSKKNIVENNKNKY